MSAATTIPMGSYVGTASKRPLSKKRYQPLEDVEIRFVSVVLVALIYLQIVVNQNIAANTKGLLLIFSTAILTAFFWDTLEKVAQKWWHRSFIGFNSLYFLDPENKSLLREIIVPRWRVLHTELPPGVIAISIPLGGFLNFPCVVSEHEKIINLWRIRERKDIQNTQYKYIQLTDQFKDGVSFPVNQALLFLEFKEKALEFFPNWMQEFEDMHELISDLAAELDAHSNECREEYITALKAEIEGFRVERAKLRESQRKLSTIISKSTQTISTQQFIELIIRGLTMQEHQEHAHRENSENTENSEESSAA
ncbi:hypothetical protein HYW94_04330 [Candidatus Uhrbacteria bacterium]|nr:hypothetical protein [Candidatus Uhrbacteria bacterium]